MKQYRPNKPHISISQGLYMCYYHGSLFVGGTPQEALRIAGFIR